MTETDVESTVREIVARHVNINPADIIRDTRLESLNIESLDLIEIIFEIEDRFDINIDQDERSAKLTTVGEMLDWLTTNVGTQANR
jgi:acyl carrier protein